jgi:hypothetical protein
VLTWAPGLSQLIEHGRGALGDANDIGILLILIQRVNVCQALRISRANASRLVAFGL